MKTGNWSLQLQNKTSGSADDDNVYVILTAMMCLLSVLGCIAIVVVYLAFQRLRTPTRKLLVYLSVADLLTAIGNLLGIVWFIFSDSVLIHRSMGYCKFHAALTVFSSISSFMWTLTMGLCLYLCIVKNKPKAVESHMVYFHLACWVFPAIIASVALGFDVLGYDQSLDQATWCWIDPRVPHALFWQFFTGKAWEIISCVLTTALYARLKIFLLKQKDKSKEIVQQRRKKQHVINEANRKLTFVPLVFIILRFWGTLRFLLGVFAHDYASSSDSAWLAPLQGIGDSAQGFANFVLYCFFTERVRNQLRLTLCPCILRERRVSNEQRASEPSNTNSNTNNTADDG
ncbi:G-protein coupled receptor 157-like [Liolophura sinensis]|uniref:G-protein coupled receptor 157-like n=1 Tax=Liolophura sinensis TaxID=3198878 RepID=UPI0031580E26